MVRNSDKGWRGESSRHSLAARGIKSAQRVNKRMMKNPKFEMPTEQTRMEAFKIAKAYGMDDSRADDLLTFFRMRFPHHMQGDYLEERYFDTWANRFASGTEWFNADMQSSKALMKTNPNRYRGYDENEDFIKQLDTDEFISFNNALNRGASAAQAAEDIREARAEQQTFYEPEISGDDRANYIDERELF